MKVGLYQTIELVEIDQIKGKILEMPGGDGCPYFLVEVIELHPDNECQDNLGCQVLVPKDRVFKYTRGIKAEIAQQEVIFDLLAVVAQYKDRDSKLVFKLETQRLKDFEEQVFDPRPEK